MPTGFSLFDTRPLWPTFANSLGKVEVRQKRNGLVGCIFATLERGILLETLDATSSAVRTTGHAWSPTLSRPGIHSTVCPKVGMFPFPRHSADGPTSPGHEQEGAARTRPTGWGFPVCARSGTVGDPFQYRLASRMAQWQGKGSRHTPRSTPLVPGGKKKMPHSRSATVWGLGPRAWSSLGRSP